MELQLEAGCITYVDVSPAAGGVGTGSQHACRRVAARRLAFAPVQRPSCQRCYLSDRAQANSANQDPTTSQVGTHHDKVHLRER